MTDLDLDAIHKLVGAYAQLMCTKAEFRSQAFFDSAAHAVAEVAPKLFLEVERLHAEEQSWADTILEQRDAAIETVARVRALLDESECLTAPYGVECNQAVWVDDLRKALDPVPPPV